MALAILTVVVDPSQRGVPSVKAQAIARGSPARSGVARTRDRVQQQRWPGRAQAR